MTFFPSGDLLVDRRYTYAEALLAEDDCEAAADLLRQALERAPDWIPAWMALAVAEERRGRIDAALEAYRRAEALDRSGVFGASLHQARLQGAAPPAMPAAYVAALFDDYAPRFDAHLTGKLHYRGPALLAEALNTVEGARRFGEALDLGCGTGLMGAALAGRVGALDGVDLSAKMVDLARATGRYRHLWTADITACLSDGEPERYDLVVAADVFVYLGSLDGVLAATARILRSGGLLGFTLQSQAGEGYRLGDDLRYAHAPDHVREVLAANGLAPLVFQPASTRREKGIDVPGLVVVAQKPHMG